MGRHLAISDLIQLSQSTANKIARLIQAYRVEDCVKRSCEGTQQDHCKILQNHSFLVLANLVIATKSSAPAITPTVSS